MLPFAVALSACSPVQAEVEPWDPRLAEVMVWVEGQLDGWHVPGVAVAVVEGGRVVGVMGAGSTEAGGTEAIASDTRFRIGSLSKMLTAMVALQQEGALDLDAPAGEALGDLEMEAPDSLHDFSIADLLSHQSGLQIGGMPDDCDTDADADARILAERVPEWSAWYPRGELFVYSDEGYALAGYAAERAAGRDYVELVEHGVFGPAGMETATFDRDEAKRAPHATGHSVDAATGELTATHDLGDRDCRVEYPAGGAVGTVTDLGQLARLLLDQGEGVLSAAQWARFTGEGWAFSDTSRYGLGVNVTTWRDMPVLTHTGSVPGTSSLLWVMPEQNLGVAVLVNADHTTSDPPRPWTRPTQLVLLRVLETFLELEHEEVASTVRPVEDWARYVGRYLGTDGQGERLVRLRGETLVVIDPDETLELVPYSRDTFKYARWSTVRETTYWEDVEFVETDGAQAAWIVGSQGVWARVSSPAAIE